MHSQNNKSNLPLEEPIYVYFDYNGVKVSELFIPTETKSLAELIIENSYKYKIPKELFYDMVIKNKVNLTENNQDKNCEAKNKVNFCENSSDRYDKLNSISTRSNFSKNYKNNNPNTNDNLNTSNRKKEMIYNEILSYEDNEIPKNKLIELTSNLLESSNKSLFESKKLIEKIENNNIHKLNDNKIGDNIVSGNPKNINSNNNVEIISLKNRNSNHIDAEKNSNKNNNSNLPNQKETINLNNKNLNNKSNSKSGNKISNLKSPKNIKIDLNFVSGVSKKKNQNKEGLILKSDLFKEKQKSPNYNFLNTNNLLIKNYKKVNTYAEKEAYSKQIKTNINQDRIKNIKDNQTYKIYNYNKILPDNLKEVELENNGKVITQEINLFQTDECITDLNKMNYKDDVIIENFDNKIFQTSKTENDLKQFKDPQLRIVNTYNDLNNIILSNVPSSNKISNSNSNYVSLKNKLDYIKDFNLNKQNLINNNKDNILSSEDNLENSNNFNKNFIPNQQQKANKISNGNFNANYNFIASDHRILKNTENDEKFLRSETMSEKSSFLFNKHSVNFDILSTNNKKNIINNSNIYTDNTNNNININILSNIKKDNDHIQSFKNLMKGSNGIQKMKKNQLSRSTTKLDRSVSYGERLFYKGAVFEEKKEKKNQVYKKIKEEEFEKNCTFKPKLNPNSIAINDKINFSQLYNSSNMGMLHNNFSSPNILKNNFNSNENNLNLNNIENLSNFNQSVNFSCENINKHFNKNKIKYKNKQCNHNPILNHTVNYKDNDKSNLTRVNNNSKILNKTCFKSPEEIDVLSKRLYDNAEKYRNKKVLLQENYYSQICPFNPEIISRDDCEIPNMQNFFNRLQTWVDKRNEKYEFDLEKNQYDEKTGNRLFSPQINKSKKHTVKNRSFNLI